MRYENSIENDFRARLLKWAADTKTPLKVLKLNVQGTRGWPDRLIIWGGGRSMYIEFKRPGQELRKLQKMIHTQLIEMGHNVQTFDDTDEALAYVQAKILSTGTPNTRDDAWGQGGGLSPVLETGPREDCVCPENL